MIYASTSVVINSNLTNLWNVIEKFLSAPTQGNYIKDCTVQETYYDGFIRSSNASFSAQKVTERVFLVKEQNKIVVRLEDHISLVGDIIYQLIVPDNPDIDDRRVTLCIVLAWRMRPGVIEARTRNQQELVEDLAESIRGAAETTILV